uniref:Uncharacterized protein n=1 Tax=Physcomitrium patens TaxID=3218 RepID=A0A2K1JZ08_PHYPA|nr:hypothetical protein PHYPA_013876 [Physcomitrium patens]
MLAGRVQSGRGRGVVGRWGLGRIWRWDWARRKARVWTLWGNLVRTIMSNGHEQGFSGCRKCSHGVGV